MSKPYKNVKKSGGKDITFKQLIEPHNLTFNAGNHLCPHYRRVPYRGLIIGDSIIQVEDRHSRKYTGVFQETGITDCGRYYCVTSFLLEKEAAEMEEIEGSVISARKQLTPSHIKRQIAKRPQDISLSLILKGYDLYFDGVVDIHEVGRLSTGTKRYQESFS